MTGIIRLYNKNGLRLKSAVYFNTDDRKVTVNRWMVDYEFEQWNSFYFQIIPDVVEPENYKEVKPVPKVINMVLKTHKRANFKHVSVPLKDVEMPGFVYDMGLKHESYYHRCYYKNEKQ